MCLMRCRNASRVQARTMVLWHWAPHAETEERWFRVNLLSVFPALRGCHFAQSSLLVRLSGLWSSSLFHVGVTPSTLSLQSEEFWWLPQHKHENHCSVVTLLVVSLNTVSCWQRLPCCRLCFGFALSCFVHADTSCFLFCHAHQHSIQGWACRRGSCYQADVCRAFSEGLKLS